MDRSTGGGLVAVAVGVGAVAALASDAGWPGVGALALGLAAAAGLVWVSAVRPRSSARGFWRAVVAAGLLQAAGAAAWTAVEGLGRSGLEPVGDALWLAGFVVLGGGVVSLTVRRDGMGGWSALEAALVAVCAVSPALVLVLRDMTMGDGRESFALATAHSLLDLALVAAAVRLCLARGRWNASTALVVAGVVVLFAADILSDVAAVRVDVGIGRVQAAAWLAGFGCLVLASRRPSAASVASTDPAVGGARHARRLIVASSAAVVVPILAVLGSFSGLWALATRDLALILAITVVTVVLATPRWLALVTEIEDAARVGGAVRLAALVENGADLVFVISADATMAYASRSTATYLGVPPDGLIGRHVNELLADIDREPFDDCVGWLRRRIASGRNRVSEQFRLADGTAVEIEFVLVDMLDDDNVRGIVVSGRDVSNQRRMERELAHRATHDALTGVANRDLFLDATTTALDRLADGLSRGVAVLYVDLDGFKAVNDGIGHASGDRVLSSVADRLVRCTRDGDIVGRLGGDEFAILLGDVRDRGEAVEVAERVLELLRLPVDAIGVSLSIAASIGIAYTAVPLPTDLLVRNADLAMYAAKRKGKGRYDCFDEGMNREAVAALQLRVELVGALARQEMLVQYQPIVEAGSGDVAGLEALLRWAHPTRGLLRPGAFLGAAEDAGFVTELARLVLRRACADGARWNVDRPGSPLFVAVNVSGPQLLDPAFPDVVRDALAWSGLAPSSLLIEMSESALLYAGDVADGACARLKELGVRLAIDDFGGGIASLGSLRRFPVDAVHLSGSVIRRLRADDGTAPVARSIIEVAEWLALASVAEGIESELEASLARSIGCTLLQGNHVGRPVSPEEIDDQLARGAMLA